MFAALVWVSQKVAWAGMANARLRADSAAGNLHPDMVKHWLQVVEKVSRAHEQRPSHDVVCRFHWRGTLALLQGFQWRTSQLKPRPAAIADAAPPAEEASQAKDAGAEVKVEEKKAAGGRKRKTKDESEPAKRARK